jgi:hypothetical protein
VHGGGVTRAILDGAVHDGDELLLDDPLVAIGVRV